MYELKKYAGDLSVSMKLKRRTRLSPTLQDDDRESPASLLVTLLWFAATPAKPRANMFFTVEEVKFLWKMV